MVYVCVCVCVWKYGLAFPSPVSPLSFTTHKSLSVTQSKPSPLSL